MAGANYYLLTALSTILPASLTRHPDHRTKIGFIIHKSSQVMKQSTLGERKKRTKTICVAVAKSDFPQFQFNVILPPQPIHTNTPPITI
jgi:hypothetical protein